MCKDSELPNIYGSSQVSNLHEAQDITVGMQNTKNTGNENAFF